MLYASLRPDCLGRSLTLVVILSVILTVIALICIRSSLLSMTECLYRSDFGVDLIYSIY